MPGQFTLGKGMGNEIKWALPSLKMPQGSRFIVGFAPVVGCAQAWKGSWPGIIHLASATDAGVNNVIPQMPSQTVLAEMHPHAPGIACRGLEVGAEFHCVVVMLFLYGLPWLKWPP